MRHSIMKRQGHNQYTTHKATVPLSIVTLCHNSACALSMPVHVKSITSAVMAAYANCASSGAMNPHRPMPSGAPSEPLPRLLFMGVKCFFIDFIVICYACFFIAIVNRYAGVETPAHKDGNPKPSTS